jgi:hypothetical protein
MQMFLQSDPLPDSKGKKPGQKPIHIYGIDKFFPNTLEFLQKSKAARLLRFENWDSYTVEPFIFVHVYHLGSFHWQGSSRGA